MKFGTKNSSGHSMHLSQTTNSINGVIYLLISLVVFYLQKAVGSFDKDFTLKLNIEYLFVKYTFGFQEKENINTGIKLGTFYPGIKLVHYIIQD